MKFDLYPIEDMTMYSADMHVRADSDIPDNAVFYHGTSANRLLVNQSRPDLITQLKQKTLIPSDVGNPIISLTADMDIAKYWAVMATLNTEVVSRSCACKDTALILEFHIQDLVRFVNLYHFSDPCYGPGHCDEEYEICTDSPIQLAVVSWNLHTLPLDGLWKFHPGRASGAFQRDHVLASSVSEGDYLVADEFFGFLKPNSEYRVGFDAALRSLVIRQNGLPYPLYTFQQDNPINGKSYYIGFSSRKH